MKFDFTPDPKVLIALTHTTMQPLDALCELIDNAIDSFYSAKILGLTVDTPMIIVSLPSRKQLSSNAGILRVQDNGPGMTAENAEKAIKAGFSGNNPYDTLGLYGMGFNISTGKLGNKTVLMTSRKDMSSYIRTEIDLSKINSTKDYSLEAVEILKGTDGVFSSNGHGTIIEVMDWWPEGNANRGFIQKLVCYGLPKIREEIGRRYATILRKGEIKIIINDEKCDAFEHCVWNESRYVTRKNGNVPAIIRFDQVLKVTKRCGKCTAILGSDDVICPSCQSTSIRSINEKVTGWVGIQRFDSDTEFGIDLIRNGRAIKTGEKSAFFEYVDEFKHIIKDYPIDSQYGRIVGEIHLDFVPIDFLKQDFQRSSAEWQLAMEFIRGKSSLQPTQPGASENNSPIFRLYQAYRRVRQFGRGDMYMGYWDADSRSAKRISRDTEKEYYEKFKKRLPGYYDDSEWWKLVETADQPPVEELPECPFCGTQNLKDAEVCGGCGEILLGKICTSCGKKIPVSAKSCPHCAVSQIPIVLEPWTCKVCGKKNVATDDNCKDCGSKRGTKHPLDKEELLKTSAKIDSLSSDGISIVLADGKRCNPVKVQVYSTQKPLNSPTSKKSSPLIISKEIGNLTIFVDLSHPIFTKCGMSKEQLIASEIAMYLYQERMNLSNRAEHNLSTLTWDVMQANWKDVIEISSDTIYDDAKSILSDISDRLKENSRSNLSVYFDEMTIDQKKILTDNMIRNGVDLATIGELKESGKYITYTPPGFIAVLYREDPDIFFGGKVWNIPLAFGGEELLGHEVVAQAREKIISQYGNYLQDLVLYLDNRYTDILTLQRVKLSIEFLRKELVA